MRVRRPVQPRRGGQISGQGDQPEPAVGAGPVARHGRRAAQIRPGIHEVGAQGRRDIRQRGANHRGGDTRQQRKQHGV